jgi:hypothetical protein
MNSHEFFASILQLETNHPGVNFEQKTKKEKMKKKKR